MQLIVDSEKFPLNWKIKTLDELCEIARGGSPRPIQQFLTTASDGVNWIKISDASASSKYIYQTKEKIKPDGVKRSRFVNEGDFILSNSMSFGRPYIIRTSGCIHDGWLVLKDKSGLFDQDYLYYFLGSNTTYKQFDNLAAGSTVRNLNIDLVRGVKVILPPLLEQKRIVTILDETFEGIDRAIANTEKNLTNARELFESYLNTIFTQQSNGWKTKRLGDISEVQSGGTPSRSKSNYWGGHLAWYSSGELNDLYTTSPERNITNEGLNNSNSKLFPKGSLLIGMYDTAALKMSILDREAAFNQAIAGVKPNNKIDLVLFYMRSTL
jgi:restriction endonuclease S subunit